MVFYRFVIGLLHVQHWDSLPMIQQIQKTLRSKLSAFSMLVQRHHVQEIETPVLPHIYCQQACGRLTVEA